MLNNIVKNLEQCGQNRLCVFCCVTLRTTQHWGIFASSNFSSNSKHIGVFGALISSHCFMYVIANSRSVRDFLAGPSLG